MFCCSAGRQSRLDISNGRASICQLHSEAPPPQKMCAMSYAIIQNKMKDIMPPKNWPTKTSFCAGKCRVTWHVIFVKIMKECATFTRMNTKMPDKPSHFRRPATHPAMTPDHTLACESVLLLCWRFSIDRNSPSSTFCCTLPFLPSAALLGLAPGLLAGMATHKAKTLYCSRLHPAP